MGVETYSLVMDFFFEPKDNGYRGEHHSHGKGYGGHRHLYGGGVFAAIRGERHSSGDEQGVFVHKKREDGYWVPETMESGRIERQS